MPRTEHAFEADLNPLAPLHDQLRVRFTTEGNVLVAFVVQYETYVDGRWLPVVRYDTSHGEAHRDDYTPTGVQIRKQWLGVKAPPFNDVYTAALSDLRENWRTYSRAFRAMERGRQ